MDTMETRRISIFYLPFKKVLWYHRYNMIICYVTLYVMFGCGLLCYNYFTINVILI